METVILGAGYGTRLYPLTKNLPKAFIEINQKKIIDYLIEKIESLNYKKGAQVHVVTNDRFYKDFKNWRDSLKTNLDVIIYNDGTTKPKNALGAIGDLKYVLDEAKINDDVLLLASDNFIEFGLNGLYNTFENKGKNTTIVAVDLKDKKRLANRYGVIELNGDFVVGFEEKPAKPKTSMASVAIYLFSQKDVSRIKKRTIKKDNLGEVIKMLIRKDKVYCYVTNKRWFDIGSFESLNKARDWAKKNLST